MKKNKQEQLDYLIDELDNFKQEFVDSSERILRTGNQLGYALDFFANAVNNRAFTLSKGFISLVKEENYLCAIPLIRIQLDNGLRFFASTLVKDTNDFFNHFISGKPIRDYIGITGKKLTDSYLAKKLDIHFPGVIKLYKDTSGHIHLSDNHFWATMNLKDESGSQKYENRVGNHDSFSIESKIDYVHTMLEVSKLVLITVEQWKFEKERLSTEYLSSIQNK